MEKKISTKLLKKSKTSRKTSRPKRTRGGKTIKKYKKS